MGRLEKATDPAPSPGPPRAHWATGARRPRGPERAPPVTPPRPLPAAPAPPDRPCTRPRTPAIKQHLAVIRRLCDWLVTGQVITTNPATSVRGPTHVGRTGKTPVLQPAEARQLLDTINTSTVPGLRDRALLGVMVYSFARVSAVVGMRVEDYYQQGKRRWLRLQEKGASTTPCRSTTRRRPVSPRPESRPRKSRPCGARCRGPAGWARVG